MRSRFGAALFCFELTARDSVTASCFRSCFAVDCLATVFPHNNRSKKEMQAAKTEGHEPVGPIRRAEECECTQGHETETHGRHGPYRKHTAGDHTGPIKQKPHAGNRIELSGTCEHEGQKTAGDDRRRETKEGFASRS